MRTSRVVLSSERFDTIEALKKRVVLLERYDPVTGLANRDMFLELTNEVMKSSSAKGAIFIVDLDNFRTLTYPYGYTVGDELLKLAVPQLSDCLREGDFIARLRGDEFGILFPDCDSLETAVGIANRILSRFNTVWTVLGHEFFLTASIGIAFLHKDGEDTANLLQNAASALYEAKRNGKNQYGIYEKAANERHIQMVELENDFRNAIRQGEISAYFQPEVEAESGEILGMEVLARWIRRNGKNVPPSQFIPMAEDTGLIIPLGNHILSLACGRIREWNELRYGPFRIAVNVSAKQLQQSGFVPFVRQIIVDNDVDPSFLELEITESELVKSMRTTVETLERLRRVGIKISLDDFGTGYSSLSYLKNLPIDKIKIDRSFVGDIGVNSKSEAVILAIIVLAEKMGLEIVAEGVETPEQAFFLMNNGCREIQGYLFSKPVSASEMTALLAKRRIILPWNSYSAYQI